ncbi:MAG: DUF3244 domain-containing protein [Tannerellaceae bacterium]|jgi:hypothetical protein|nr:DUF3244 domain-containing protein [Tannerellaceae bacterium]
MNQIKLNFNHKIMRAAILVLCFFIVGLFTLHADSVPVNGEWNPIGLRSSASPATLPPLVSITNNVLSLYFPSALSNLTVTVSDADGNVVYQTCISGASGYTYIIPLDVSPGEYQLTLTHSYGTLSGYFDVE